MFPFILDNIEQFEPICLMLKNLKAASRDRQKMAVSCPSSLHQDQWELLEVIESRNIRWQVYTKWSFTWSMH